MVKPIPITTYKNQPQQTALSREKRKRIIQHNNLKPPSANQAEASSISTTPLQSNHPLCEKENSTSSRQNRRRVISEKRVSPPFGMANAQRKSINTFNYTTPLAEITNAKQIFFTNHDHVTNTVDSSSITTTPLQSKLTHYHKENSTASRVNRTSVRLDKTVSPSFPIPNTPTTSKKNNGVTTPLGDITASKQSLLPNQSHVPNTLDEKTFTQPNAQIHCRLPRQPKRGINLLTKFAATAHPIPSANVDPNLENGHAKTTEHTIPSNTSDTDSIHESFEANSSSESDTDEDHDSDLHTESDSEDDMLQQNTNAASIPIGEPLLLSLIHI